VVGNPIANCEQAEAAILIGLFVNSLAFRSDPSENPSFIALIPTTKSRLN
jgi:hypothetical protein